MSSQIPNWYTEQRSWRWRRRRRWDKELPYYTSTKPYAQHIVHTLLNVIKMKSMLNWKRFNGIVKIKRWNTSETISDYKIRFEFELSFCYCLCLSLNSDIQKTEKQKRNKLKVSWAHVHVVCHTIICVCVLRAKDCSKHWLNDAKNLISFCFRSKTPKWVCVCVAEERERKSNEK